MIYDLRSDQANERFREGVVMAIPAATHGGLDAGHRQTLAVGDAQVLTAPVAEMDQRPIDYPAVQRLL